MPKPQIRVHIYIIIILLCFKNASVSHCRFSVTSSSYLLHKLVKFNFVKLIINLLAQNKFGLTNFHFVLSENYLIQTGYFLYNWNNIHFKQIIISYAQKLFLPSDYHFLQWESSIPILGVLDIYSFPISPSSQQRIA